MEMSSANHYKQTTVNQSTNLTANQLRTVLYQLLHIHRVHVNIKQHLSESLNILTG